MEVQRSIEVAQVARSVANIDLDQEQMARFDFQPTERDHFYLRYIYQDTPLIAYVCNLVAGDSSMCKAPRTRSAVIGHTLSLQSGLISCDTFVQNAYGGTLRCPILQNKLSVEAHNTVYRPR
jgi:hypothetical protein